jgi:hypothetical protein
MKVLHQLIKHFWQRGALTKEQADYLVEHGFIRPGELEHYEPPVAVTEEAAPVRILPPPDPLYDKEEELSRSASARHKGKAPRMPDYSAESLGADLRMVLGAREIYAPALGKLSPCQPIGTSIQDAAHVRHQSPEAFRQRVCQLLELTPNLLAKWWECLDPEPFYLLLAQPGVRGAVARAFATILNSAAPGEWGPSAWLLKVAEVQTVANLLAIRRQMLPAVRWLYDKNRDTLDRCVRRPSRPPRSWTGLGLGLVIARNARAWRAKRRPSGYALTRLPSSDIWQEAWTTAIGLDAQRVIPYCVHILGNHPSQVERALGDFAITDRQLICPAAWKI